MSFFAEASPITKAVIVLGPILIVVATWFSCSSDAPPEGVVNERGVQSGR